jgi:hypothetical protein
MLKKEMILQYEKMLSFFIDFNDKQIIYENGEIYKTSYDDRKSELRETDHKKNKELIEKLVEKSKKEREKKIKKEREEEIKNGKLCRPAFFLTSYDIENLDKKIDNKAKKKIQSTLNYFLPENFTFSNEYSENIIRYFFFLYSPMVKKMRGAGDGRKVYKDTYVEDLQLYIELNNVIKGHYGKQNYDSIRKEYYFFNMLIESIYIIFEYIVDADDSLTKEPEQIILEKFVKVYNETMREIVKSDKLLPYKLYFKGKTDPVMKANDFKGNEFLNDLFEKNEADNDAELFMTIIDDLTRIFNIRLSEEVSNKLSKNVADPFGEHDYDGRDPEYEKYFPKGILSEYYDSDKIIRSDKLERADKQRILNAIKGYYVLKAEQVKERIQASIE